MKKGTALKGYKLSVFVIVITWLAALLNLALIWWGDDPVWSRALSFAGFLFCLWSAMQQMLALDDIIELDQQINGYGQSLQSIREEMEQRIKLYQAASVPPWNLTNPARDPQNVLGRTAPGSSLKDGQAIQIEVDDE